MTTALRIILAAATLVSVTSDSAAQPKSKAPTAEQQAAQTRFQKGREYYNFGAYDDAIREYEAAYALAPLPEILFNIGQVYRAKKDRVKARDYYRRYLEATPSGTGAEIAMAHIATIDTELAAEAEAAERKRAAEADALRKRELEEQRLREESEARARSSAERSAEIAAKRRVEEEADESRQRTARVLKWSGLGALGVGAVTSGVGIGFGFKARSLSNDASQATGTWTDEHERTVERAESAQRTMYILVGVGSALVLGGAALYVGGWRLGRNANTPELTVQPTADGGAVSLSGWF